METLKVKNRNIVVPGETLAEGMGFLPSRGTYRDGKTIKAKRLGMISIDKKVIKLIPLSGAYMPKVGDKIIAKVIDIMMSGWRVDTRSAYSAVLGLKDATSDYIAKGADLTQYFGLGDYVLTQITNVTSQKLIDVTMRGPGLRKLRGGRIININPHKVPRVIGKEGSMVTMIKQATECNILVGQNGRIWIDGEPEKEVITEETINKIEKEAHTAGLTDNIKKFLEKKTGKKLEVKKNNN
ncbi:exosome complex protein Rrp4 [Candidatus Woesearchaeota archaeon]|nr:exosome complex protein Rrp4 [Candidatus Woesearchaeota archaeon]MBW2978696.1 exosome complex protein Rrp4 [Candidatus Woesearchaeota archaeon]